jgi:hypothetical protein
MGHGQNVFRARQVRTYPVSIDYELFAVLVHSRRVPIASVVRCGSRSVVCVESLQHNILLFQAICPGRLWAWNNRCLLFRVQRLAGPAGDRGFLSRLDTPNGTKGGLFVRVGTTNRDKRPPFCPGWCLQLGQKTLAPLSPSLSPRPSQSAHLFLAVLGSGERSFCSFLHHICEDL